MALADSGAQPAPTPLQCARAVRGVYFCSSIFIYYIKPLLRDSQQQSLGQLFGTDKPHSVQTARAGQELAAFVAFYLPVM